MSKHCDDYLDDETAPECLRRFLDYQCRPAALKYPTGDEAFDKAIEDRHGLPMWRDPVPMLFARHEGKPVRVTMASRFGDVGITEELSAEHGYGKRVAVEDLTEFSDVTPVVTMSVDCAQGTDDPVRPKKVAWSEMTISNGMGGYLANHASHAGAVRHNEGIASLLAPSPLVGNRAQRRAAAADARRRA